MPYKWTPDHRSLPQRATQHVMSSDVPSDAPRRDVQTDAPLLRLDLWPHRSLKGKGFSATIWIMFFGGLIPVVPFIGTIAFWILLIFMMTALAALWLALRRSDRDHLREALLIWPDRITLTHWPAKGKALAWEANPYWVKLSLHPMAGTVEQYLTLKGGGPAQTREVELGAFLTPEERESLRDDLALVLGRLNG